MNLKKIVLVLTVMVLALSLVSCGNDSDSFSDEDLIFDCDGESFSLDGDSAPLIEKLGDDYTFEEAVSCAYSGMDKTFSYPGIDIYTYPLNDKDNIDEIYISLPAFSTKRGITVGSTLDDIKSAYGEIYTDLGGGMLVIAPEGSLEDTSDACIYFILQEDVVVEFSFYSASNRQ
jgi:hypothetical protein